VLKVSAPYLSTPIAEEDFHFNGTVLTGVKEAQPRWETCGEVVDRDLSDALGEAFVAKYFPAEAKRRMALLVENLRAAMRDELEHSEWMAAETRKNAILKLNALNVKIGYPDRWRDYSALKISGRVLRKRARDLEAQSGYAFEVASQWPRMEHDAADRERVFQFGQVRLCSRGNPAASVLRHRRYDAVTTVRGAVIGTKWGTSSTIAGRIRLYRDS
jgi:predicted metalloendopeptidase